MASAFSSAVAAVAFARLTDKRRADRCALLRAAAIRDRRISFLDDLIFGTDYLVAKGIDDPR